MAGELLKSQGKVSAVHIPYAGAGPAQLGLLAGQTDFMFDNLASATAQIKAGKLKAFAVTTPQRAPSLPDVPTMAESGVPGFDVSTWFGIFAPAGTPAPVVARLNEAFTAALRTPEMRERLGAHGRGTGTDVVGAVRATGQVRACEVRKGRQVLRRPGRLKPPGRSMKINDAKDFWSGVMFAAFGLFFVVVSHSGTTWAPRRGWDPRSFRRCWADCCSCSASSRRSRRWRRSRTAGKVDRFHFKPLLLVLGAVVAFGLLLRPAGLLVALAALVFISSLGSDEFRLRDVLLLTIGLAVLVLIVFIYALEMTVPVLPAFLRT